MLLCFSDRVIMRVYVIHQVNQTVYHIIYMYDQIIMKTTPTNDQLMNESLIGESRNLQSKIIWHKERKIEAKEKRSYQEKMKEK